MAPFSEKRIPENRTRPGLLVVGHGTRDPCGVAEFHAAVLQVADRLPHVVVRAGFLELTEPSIGEGLRLLSDKGVTHAAVVPLLLLDAGHAKQDIPAEIDRARTQLSFEQLQASPHLGLHERLLRLSADRAEEAVAEHGPADAEYLLVLVGRGNRDPAAWEEMLEFARRRAAPKCADVRVAYLAMAQPSFDDVAHEVSRLPTQTVVVQPHLLFEGQMLASLKRRVAELDRESVQHWILARHLGPSPLLVDAIVDRFMQTES
jgi:sirohydrochlorin ferrochelatase